MFGGSEQCLLRFDEFSDVAELVKAGVANDSTGQHVAVEDKTNKDVGEPSKSL